MHAQGHDPELGRVLVRAAEGDAQAWRVLVETYSRRVFGLLVRQCGDRDLAEEITQATFVQVVSHIGRYREHGKFEPWLFRIAMNRLRDEMRRRKRRARTMDMTGGRSEDGAPWAAAEEQLTERTGEPTTTLSPLDRVTRAEEVRLLQEAVETLNQADQEILYLRHTAGLSFAEIAKTLREPMGTVLARGHRALAKLRKLLESDAKDTEDEGPGSKPG
jgi:RNA polymerase sigma-70 factor (ECF subfamily)